MIKIKTKITGTDEQYQYVNVVKYKTKNTTAAEHLCLINVLIDSILDNDEDLNINDVCKLIKNNYKTLKEEEK